MLRILLAAALLAAAEGGRSARPAPPSEEALRAGAAEIRRGWAARAASKDAAVFTLHEGLTVRLRLDGGSLPAGGLGENSPAGLEFRATAFRGVATQTGRLVVSPGSVFFGKVLQSSELKAKPFRPGRLRLYFYKVEDPALGTTIPIQAVAAWVRGWETSAGGTILSHRTMVLNGGHWIGVRLLQTQRVRLASDRRLPLFNGRLKGDRLQVTRVEPGSDAQEQGLAVGDEVVEVDGERFAAGSPWTLLAGPPASRVKLKVLKGGKPDQAVKLTLMRGALVKEGVGLRLRDGRGGATTKAPVPGSPADRAGLEEGLRLLAVDGKDCGSAAECRPMLKGRDGTRVELTLRYPGDKEPRRTELRAGRYPEVPR